MPAALNRAQHHPDSAMRLRRHCSSCGQGAGIPGAEPAARDVDGHLQPRLLLAAVLLDQLEASGQDRRRRLL
eukprot:scaffold33533_cov36-Phaeocystis_antarctica.AAC.1